jgi:S-adenosylmethionine synthetase
VVSDEEIQRAILEVFDLRPAAIIRDLRLMRPIYRTTAAYGHFGRPQGANVLLDADDPNARSTEPDTFTWESVDRADALRSVLGV